MLAKPLVLLPFFAAALSRSSPTSIGDVTSTFDDPKRSLASALKDYFPDCANDASTIDVPSQYTDGEGRFVGYGCEDKRARLKKFYCWTDVSVVSSQIEYSEWENTGQTIDCATTNQCLETTIQMNQSCTSDETTWDNQIGAALKVEFDLKTWILASVAPELSFDHSFGGSKSVRICTTSSNLETCSWNEQKCHAVWSAEQRIRINGYLRRSCNYGPDDKKATRRKNGDWTVGTRANPKPFFDFSFTVPNNRILGCAASCGDRTYPFRDLDDHGIVPISGPPNPGQKTRLDVKFDDYPM